MSLAKFTLARLVIQHPHTSAYDAMRAMKDNHVGAVIVCERRRVVGMVTDRDLALHVVGEHLDPMDLTLGQIMSTPVAVVSNTASETDAAQAMLAEHVRRIPIVDDETVIGMITLDDLILEQSVPPALLAQIVRAQLAEPRRLKRAGDVHPTRPATQTGLPDRAEERRSQRERAAYDALIERAQSGTGLSSVELVEAALDEVLLGVIRRITPDEARHLLAQLPRLLQQRLASGACGPDVSITRAGLERAVQERLGIEREDAAALILSLCEILGTTISAGELADVRRQLPADMKDLFAPTHLH